MPIRRALLLIAVLFAAREAEAASAAPLDVERLVARALEGNPTVGALGSRLASAHEMEAPSGALPDPMIEVSYVEAGFPHYTVGETEMSMIAGSWRQAFPRSSKRETRREVARADAAVVVAEADALRRDVARDVRTTCAGIRALDVEIGVLESSREMLDLLSATTSARYGAGEEDREGAVKAQILLSRLEERKTDLGSERRKLVLRLARLLGERAAGFDLPAVDALPTPDFPPEPWDDAAVAGSAEVAARRAEMAAAGKRIDAARSDLAADWSAGVAAGYRGSFDPVVTLSLGVEWPFRKNARQMPRIRAAESDLESARLAELEAENEARENALSLSAARLQAETQLVRYRDGVLPLAREAMAAARTQYLAGRGGFSTMVEDFNLWLEAKVGVAHRESDLYAAAAELRRLLGPEPGTEDEGGHR